MENSNSSNRLYLNLNNDSRFQSGENRAYPTTPSTFPNPIFPGQQQGGQQQTQNYQQQQQYQNGTAPGYFMNNPYPPANPQQYPASNYQTPQAPQASYQGRANAPLNDVTNGLARDFGNQNLGGGRQSPYGQQRGPSPSQRPRTAGAPAQQSGYRDYLNAPMPPPVQQTWPEFQLAPDRNPDKYGSTTQNNNTKCKTVAESFFKDSVKRARDRNLRLVRFIVKCAIPKHNISRFGSR